jgi:prolyl 3-hydroxylase /prolyl 3,4-dihydroxylase
VDESTSAMNKEDLIHHQHNGCGERPNGEEDSGAKKRPKLGNDHHGDADSKLLLEPLNPNLRKTDNLAALKARYESATPYPHLLVDDFLDRDFLEKTILEIKDKSKVDFKESDLFKFYQSMDLASLGCDGDGNDGHEETTTASSHVYRLRQMLYSPEWRRNVEAILGLEPNTLSDHVDCACNCHAASCHLLCHDDVIRTRKVSYILYLVDDDWSSKDGGALELYAASTSNGSSSSNGAAVPDAVPVVRHTPKFNTLCMFEVKPGVSFHSVQEVTRTSSPRLSLQGWYHAAVEPDNAHRATLSQLKSQRQGGDNNGNSSDDGFQDYVDGHPVASINDNDGVGESLSQRDVDLLATYLDPTYLQPMALKEMRERFEETSSLQLRGLFLPKHVEPLAAAMSEADQDAMAPIDDDQLYQRGVNAGWTIHGPPHMQRYLRYNSSSKTSASSSSPASSSGKMLSEMQHVMESSAFGRFLERVTGLVPTGHRGEIRRFRPGRDYTVAHYGLLRQSGVLDATLVFCAGTGEPVCEQSSDDSPDVAWQSGDVGGFECYIEADESGQDEQYRGSSAASVAAKQGKGEEDGDDEDEDNDGTELLSVSAANNTLSLVFRDPGTMRFVKYLSIQAPSSRWDIALEYRVAEDDENDDDDDDDEEGEAEEDEGE